MIKGETLLKQNRQSDLVFNLFGGISPTKRWYGLNPVYHDDSELNDLGYRSDDLQSKSDINMLFVGAEETFGLGIKKEDRYSDLLCKKVAEYSEKKVSNWNLALPNKSNDYLSRTLLTAVPELKPNFVFVMFVNVGRREVWGDDKLSMDYLPGVHYGDKSVPKDKMADWKAMSKLSNANDDYINFYKNYMLIDLLMSELEIPWLFSLSTEVDADTNMVARMADLTKFVGYFATLDTAGGGKLQGKESHSYLSGLIYEQLPSGVV